MGENRSTKTEVIAALEKAAAAILEASTILATRYGQTNENVQEMRGAALLIEQNWLPNIRAEQEDA